jgi:hypothetical protein
MQKNADVCRLPVCQIPVLRTVKQVNKNRQDEACKPYERDGKGTDYYTFRGTRGNVVG